MANRRETSEPLHLMRSSGTLDTVPAGRLLYRETPDEAISFSHGIYYYRTQGDGTSDKEFAPDVALDTDANTIMLIEAKTWSKPASAQTMLARQSTGEISSPTEPGENYAQMILCDPSSTSVNVSKIGRVLMKNAGMARTPDTESLDFYDVFARGQEQEIGMPLVSASDARFNHGVFALSPSGDIIYVAPGVPHSLANDARNRSNILESYGSYGDQVLHSIEEFSIPTWRSQLLFLLSRLASATSGRYRPVVAVNEDDHAFELEMRLSPTKELFLEVSPGGTPETVVYDDETGVMEIRESTFNGVMRALLELIHGV